MYDMSTTELANYIHELKILQRDHKFTELDLQLALCDDTWPTEKLLTLLRVTSPSSSMLKNWKQATIRVFQIIYKTEPSRAYSIMKGLYP